MIEARSSEFESNSPDLPVVVDVLNRIGELPLPVEADGWPESRWDRFAGEGEAQTIEAGTLLFTDINPHNVMIGDRQAWTWTGRGRMSVQPLSTRPALSCSSLHRGTRRSLEQRLDFTSPTHIIPTS
ncbi:hypothetical protein [Streptomyces sp. YGL11-2]|uniref:hypothetical protein n=1 Tax=Streptomyces sp. YGL11-2 TaxID=3414028 RepID=UPI003CF134DC